VAYSAPNWLFLDDQVDLARNPGEAPLPMLDGIPALPFSATAASSIGIPSSSPEVWASDIRRCRARLRLKQVMIASVVGTAHADTTQTEIIDDFSKLATEVKDAGAHVVELNFSCPNVGGRESEVYRDVEIATLIASPARVAIDTTPLLIKIGPNEERDLMAKLLRSLSGVVNGVVMINGPIRRIVDASGASAFGASRERARMVGGAVFDTAIACVRNGVDIVRRDGLNLEILAVGGVGSVERIKAFFDAGAYAVLGASACAWDPYLAIRAKRRYPML
jgi:dihydroorotate dehydrogenase